MNAPTQQAAFDMDEAQPGQELALPADINDLCDGRTKAIAEWMATYDALHAGMARAGALSMAGALGLVVPSSADRYGDSSAVTRAFLATGEARHYDREARRDIITAARDNLAAIVTKEIDRRCWDSMMTKLGFDALLDRQAREEFQASLKTDPPAFTADNCRATFATLWGGRRDMYLRGIANVFMKMDRRFRSHDAFAIGNRLIIERAMGLDSWASWSDYNRRDTLHDVERIFRELDGKGPIGPNIDIGIVREVEKAKRAGNLPTLVEGDYFRVRVFGNGNLHLWFERKDLLAEVNALLLEYYKPVEGDVGEGPSYEAGPLYHATPAKNFGAFFSSDEVAAAVLQRVDCGLKGLRVLEPSAGSGVLAKAARAAGATVTCMEIQPGLAHELGVVHGFRDVREVDFLTVAPTPTFDVVLMNPPFDRGRDCDHVRHAFKFLKPGGVLVAVMSARAEFGTDARHKALHDLIKENDSRWGWVWRDLPERSFAHAGTNVNTVTLRISKKRA